MNGIPSSWRQTPHVGFIWSTSFETSSLVFQALASKGVNLLDAISGPTVGAVRVLPGHEYMTASKSMCFGACYSSIIVAPMYVGLNVWAPPALKTRVIRIIRSGLKVYAGQTHVPGSSQIRISLRYQCQYSRRYALQREAVIREYCWDFGAGFWDDMRVEGTTLWKANGGSDAGITGEGRM